MESGGLKVLKSILTCIISLITLAAQSQVEENKSLFIQDSLKLVSSQFKFTEGPAVDKKGNIFFTDQPNNTIWKYDVEGKLSLFTAKAGRANGLFFDKKGNLIACADEQFELWSFDKNAVATVIYKNPISADLNGPNDLWIDKKGGIYFTDPYYQRDYWIRKAPAIVGEKVYYLPNKITEGSNVMVVEDSLQRPNGIVGSPDGKTLYVTDAKANKTYRYDIKSNGRLTNRKLFVSQGSDGMTLDNQGNLYLTRKGVTIYNSKGEQIGHINVPENHTANLCFGGKNRDILFITASKSVYTIKMKVKGVE
ncbi:SMP-30/gluconolactonase/LRE family protein [Pedobacter frigiditerrae]|uniref:SMP-30/gluconolactonase/LRE family protein n=1 Tax=Pedobacter frigiditerrae TaxID=2530452 RepID=A0A4R0MWN3_9SPHI|nr:SMP-30/gluconolactonase/LRE family protein [Pedobacter frigiditerrae]